VRLMLILLSSNLPLFPFRRAWWRRSRRLSIRSEAYPVPRSKVRANWYGLVWLFLCGCAFDLSETLLDWLDLKLICPLLWDWFHLNLWPRGSSNIVECFMCVLVLCNRYWFILMLTCWLSSDVRIWNRNTAFAGGYCLCPVIEKIENVWTCHARDKIIVMVP
jgi:hypothetical protein